MPDRDRLIAGGRVSRIRGSRRSETSDSGIDSEDREHIDDYLLRRQSSPPRYLSDDTSSVVTEDRSLELGTRYSLNPYRGCLHGCKYCDARPTHASFGLNAGIDFETRIYVQENAPELFREFLARRSWKPEAIALSAVTDAYQPAEREYRLTRRCLKVALESRQPVSVVTKNTMILRDRDLLRDLARAGLLHVSISIATLDSGLARSLEPQTSLPSERLRTIRLLAASGIPVQVLIAPVIAGLTDREMPAILEAARLAGARSAGFAALRLPPAVAPIYQNWLEGRQASGAQREDGSFGDEDRRGTPQLSLEPGYSEERGKSIAERFRVYAARYRLDAPLPRFDCTQFRPPTLKSGQLLLF